MPFPNGLFNGDDLKAARILDDFLPDKLFDSHAHIYDSSYAPIICQGGSFGMKPARHYEDYLEEMRPLTGDRETRINCIPAPCPSLKERRNGHRDQSTAYTAKELERHNCLVGEVMVLPEDTEDDIEKQLINPRFRGLKCYHTMVNKKETWDCDIGEYLPESAWEVANAHGLSITLHMVKHDSLSDKSNLRYIKRMAGRYKNVTLILAHAARGFASWTTVEAIKEVRPFDNVWFDFAAVCESPAIFSILKETGTERSMWGTDYPISQNRGKEISLGDYFYWIGSKELEHFSGGSSLSTYLVATETMMAIRQACIMADLGRLEIEKLFYRNAASLFGDDLAR